MTLERDYDAELKDTADHQYAYNFDLDVMHKYMMRSCEPLFKQGWFWNWAATLAISPAA